LKKMEIERKIERKKEEVKRRIRERAEQRIREQKEETEEKIQQFLQALQGIKHDNEFDGLIKGKGYTFEHTLMADDRVRDALLKRLIETYPLSKEIKRDSISEIVGIYDTVFDTSFNSIPYRLGMEKDDKLTKRASKMLLERAEKEGDIEVLIPLKHYLNLDNSVEVRRKLDFMAGMNANNKDINSVNTIYYYEKLLKWVNNKSQRKEIIDIIVAISKRRIDRNIQGIANAKKEINRLKKERAREKKRLQYQVDAITEENTPKIKELQKAMDEQERKLLPIEKERAELNDKLKELGYYNLSYMARGELKEGRVREAYKEVENKDKPKVKEMRELIKKDRQASKKEWEIREYMREIEGKMRKLQFEITNNKRLLENAMKEIDDAISDKTREIYFCANRILDALIKIGEYGQYDQIDKRDYYKYLEIALDNADRESDIKQIEQALEIIKKIEGNNV